MQLRSTRNEAAVPEAGTAQTVAGLPIDRAELEKLTGDTGEGIGAAL
jgi:hypothetical protein